MADEVVITMLGSAGGVAKAVLALLNKAAGDSNNPIHALMLRCTLHLIDRRKKSVRYYRKLLPALRTPFVVHQFGLGNRDRLREHLKESQTRIVIDVSWADTAEMLHCCNELGVAYINTALESTEVDNHPDRYEGFPLIERLKIFEHSKADFTNTTTIVCSGMNPGVVQWMVLEVMKLEPARPPLGCYIVEHDTSFYRDKTRADPKTLYTTWSPDCFLDEAILCYPMFMRQHEPLFLYEQSYALEFTVSLGAKQFSGCLMPHEEVYSLCRRAAMEGGFIYRVNEHTTALIRSHLDDIDALWDGPKRLLDPAHAELEGEDLVGVLLVYEDKERYMYNVLSNSAVFADYGVNATYFQVACGVYGALATLLLDAVPQGIYYVDDLLLTTESNYGSYLSYYMTDFVMGTNDQSQGLLLDRMKRLTL